MDIGFDKIQLVCKSAARSGLSIFRRGVDQIFPAHCPVTDSRVAHEGEISGPGWRDLSFISDPLCAGCGTPFQVAPRRTAAGRAIAAPVLCAPCSHPMRGQEALVHPDGVDRARAALIYDDVSAPLILKLKYADRHDLARPLGRMMITAATELLDDETALIVPVPQHAARLRMRRYNQAALLGQFIARQSLHAYLPDLLVRHEKTPPQKGLSADARRRNVASAFRLKPGDEDRARGAKFVLVDDVLTTGATVKACARVLKRAGAGRVDVLTIARVVGRPGDPA